MTGEQPPAPEPIPAVSDFDAVDDDAWFDRNPSRRFRARRNGGGTVLVRRVKNAVFLRSITHSIGAADTDIELAVAWFIAAYPSWSPEQITKAAFKAAKKGPDP